LSTPFDTPQWILCVSGDRQTAIHLRQSLQDLRFRAEIAGGINEALAVVQRRSPALILVDFQLIDGSGLELIRRLRQTRRAARAPIIMLATAMQAEHYSHRTLTAGPQEWLNKPVNDGQLAHAVMRWVGVVISKAMRPVEPSHDHVHKLPDRGAFAELPFARVLALATRRGKGRLRVLLRDQWLDIHIDHTHITGLSSSYLPGNSLGELLVRNNRLSPYALAEWCENIDSNQRLGEWLVEKGLINEDELAREILQHVMEKLTVAFSWRWYNAQWKYRAGVGHEGMQLACDIDVRRVIFEGIHQYYDRERLEMIFSKRERLRREMIPTTPHIDDLPVVARRVMEAADGRSSAVRVRQRAGMEVRRFYQTLYAVWVLDLVRFGDPIEDEEVERLVEEETFREAEPRSEHHHRR